MSGPSFFFLAASTAIVSMVAVQAADDVRRERVQFGRGATTVRGSIKGHASVEYLVGAVHGQILSVRMKTDNASSYFDVLPPGHDSALHIGSQQGNAYRGTLLDTGDYVVSVYLMRNAARRDETARYGITFAIENPPAAAPADR